MFWRYVLTFCIRDSNPFSFLAICFISIFFFFVGSFSYQCLLIVFHGGFSDGKSIQFSGTFLSVFTDLSNTAVCMVSIHSPISNPSSPQSSTVLNRKKKLPLTGCVIYVGGKQNVHLCLEVNKTPRKSHVNCVCGIWVPDDCFGVPKIIYRLKIFDLWRTKVPAEESLHVTSL